MAISGQRLHQRTVPSEDYIIVDRVRRAKRTRVVCRRSARGCWYAVEIDQARTGGTAQGRVDRSFVVLDPRFDGPFHEPHPIPSFS